LRVYSECSSTASLTATTKRISRIACERWGLASLPSAALRQARVVVQGTRAGNRDTLMSRLQCILTVRTGHGRRDHTIKQADRIAFYQHMLETLLTTSYESAYVTFEVIGSADEYIQYKLHKGRVYAEVGSRQCNDPERPRGALAVDSLAALGFAGGGPERNFARGGLPCPRLSLRASPSHCSGCIRSR